MNAVKNASLLSETLPKVYRQWESRAQRVQALGGPAARQTENKNLTVALAREAGTQAIPIAEAVAKRLDWPVYDRTLVDLIGLRLGMPAGALEAFDEKGCPPLYAFIKEIMTGFGSGNVISEEHYARCLRETLTTLGQRSGCVIVGRGAAQLLPASTTLRVRVVAPRNQRIAALRQQFQLSYEQAERRLDEIDRERRLFVSCHFRKDPADPDNYDLVLNLAWLSVDECADLILGGLRKLAANLDMEAESRPPATRFGLTDWTAALDAALDGAGRQRGQLRHYART